MLTPREKSVLPQAQRRIEPVTLHHTQDSESDTLQTVIPAWKLPNI